MAKQTFLNLKEEKKKLITDAFLREFALHSYDDASLTEVVKHLGIAKGSVYQYFGSKLELFMYLVEVCQKVKMEFIEPIKRNNYADFWAYLRALYNYGFHFDEKHPLPSRFLHNLAKNINSPSIRSLYSQMLDQTVSGFEKMTASEIAQGAFRDDIPVERIGYMLYKVGVSIQEYLEFSGIINPMDSIQSNSPIYKGKHDELMEVVDDYIRLVRPAFDK